MEINDYDYERLKYDNDVLRAEIDNLKSDNKALSEIIIGLKRTISEKQKMWSYFETRFVEVCKECTSEEKAKCIGFPDRCEGACNQLVDLEALIDQAIERGVK